jgi:LysM repeat protein
MNDKFTNNLNSEDEKISQKLNQVAEQTSVNSQFAAELEEGLRVAHQPKVGWFAATFRQVSPALRWVALMVLLGLVLSWSIKSLIPAPQPAIDNTPTEPVVTTPTPAPNVLPETSATPITKEGSYDFRDAKLYLEAPLPDSPNQAHVYVLKQDEPATIKQARAFADGFGIQGEIYTAPNYVFNTTDYVISDGKQSLQVYSQRYFSYTADISKTIKLSTNTPHEDAEATIREFLQARGFDFQFSILPSDFYDGYIVRLLSPDSVPMQYESYTYPALRVTLDENGEVLSVDATLMDYDSAPVGEYGIISAQEALEKVLNDHDPAGKMEFVHSAGQEMRDWFRSYPDNQPITAYGYITTYPAANAGTPPLVLFEGVPVIGNINGLESLERFTFVKARGQYMIENGIRKLSIESWDRKVQEESLPGTLSRQGDQVIWTANNGSGQQYVLIDPPVDPPLDIQAPDWLEVYGAIEDGKISWTFMRLFGDNSGGGGGGNGLGFYKLNLSGTPVPFPSPTPVPAADAEPQLTGIYTIKEGDTLSAIAQTFGITVDELMRINNLTDPIIFVGQSLSVPVPEPAEQPVQDLRGTLSIRINNKGDGTSVKEYQLEVPQDIGFSVYTMEGSILSELDPYNALPILITGTINTQGKLVVDSYKIPYPDLHFQILKGTQRTEQIEGQSVVIFTTEEGKSYVEHMVNNNIPNTTSMTGIQGDLIQQEVLIIPDETFGGLPVAHIYQSAIIQEGVPVLQVQANQVYAYNEPEDPMMSPNYTPPNLTIDHVELVYYVSNPYYQVNDPNYSQRSPYIEPAWHFRGRYEDGQEFDILIQALKPEFLLPELAPKAGMG